MTTTVPCSCPWYLSPQHARAVATESGSLADVGWMVESLIRRADGMASAHHDFPVGPDELVRFVAFHEWQDRGVMVDFMEDLAFALHYYAKGFHTRSRRVGTWAWVALLRAQRRARRRAAASEFRVFARLWDRLSRLGHAWPPDADLAVLLDATCGSA
jgi:hypothetical protein